MFNKKTKDDCQDSLNFLINHYSTERSHLFSLVFHDYHGMRIGIFVEEKDLLPIIKTSFLYTQNSNLVLTAAGIINKRELFDSYSLDSNIQEISCSGELIRNWMTNGYIHGYINEEKETIIKHVNILILNNLIDINDDFPEIKIISKNT